MNAGARLGPYEIVEQLGAGGMGEVWLATDTRLGRKVAIKVLPEQFASDRERLARFEQEARAAAALNHPNIAVVHDVGESGGVHFMVQEFLEGKSLAERLQGGALPLKTAFALATEIAEALGAAHRAGIVHRDLKPGNIFVTEDGHAKLLDFGLAKLTEVSAGAPAGQSMSPTVLGTQAGSMLGTAGYMAPEQVQGLEVDQRADLFAFGCVLHEMVSGGRAFTGKSLPHVLHRIVDEPHDALDPGTTPERLAWIVDKCLDKEPAARYQTASDLAVDLRRLAAEVASGAARIGRPAAERGRPRWAVWTSTAVALLAGIVIGAWLAGTPAAGEDVTYSWLGLPDGLRLTGTAQSFEEIAAGSERPSRPAFAFTRDGRHVVFSATSGNEPPRLYVQALGESEARPLLGTEGGFAPFLSPDGEWVGFFSGIDEESGRLSRVSIEGGSVRVLSERDVWNPAGASWGDDGTIILSRGRRLYRIADSGGPVEPLTELDETRQETHHRLPHVLPGGRAVLYTIVVAGDRDHPELGLLDRNTGATTILFQNASDGRFVAPGYLLFMREGRLFAARFDPGTGTAGEAVPVVEDVMHAIAASNIDLSLGTGHYAVAGADLLYATGSVYPPAQMELLRVDLEANTSTLVGGQGDFRFPRVSPDGGRLVYREGPYAGESDLWVLDLGRGTRQRLVQAGGESDPVWTTDGERIVYSHQDEGARNLFWRAADGSDEPAQLSTSEASQRPAAATPDGTLIFLQGGDLWTLPLDGEAREPRPLATTAALENYPAASADGRWIAYVSDAAGHPAVYVRPFPEGAPEVRVSPAGGMSPVWSRDGSWLYYVRFDPDRQEDGAQLVGVEVSDGGRFAAGPEKVIMPWTFELATPLSSWDVLDASSFVVLRGMTPVTPVTRLRLVQNWLRELEETLP